MVENKKRRKRVKSKPSGAKPASPGVHEYQARPEAKKPSRFGALMAKATPVLMFFFFGLGVLVIILNYLPDRPLIGMLPGQAAWYLLVGLGLISFGFVFATRLE